MLIGGNDIMKDDITLGTYFCTYVCLHLRLFLLHTVWQKSHSSLGREPQGNWRWNSNSRDVVASSPSFSCPATRVPGKACSQANQNASFLTPVIFTLALLYADGTPCLILLDCKLCINCIHETTRKG